jgi:hypothetical protein
MLSIFCPYRNRASMFDDFIHSYSKFYPEAYIYMVEQVDEDLFKRGQLANVMFNVLLQQGVRMENILFADIDLRLFDRIEFEEMLDRNNAVTVPFDKIELYDLITTGEYQCCNRQSYFLTGDKLTGGLTLYTKEMFERCCGFSNVYVGWGCEDSDFLLRNETVVYEKNTIFHLEHRRDSRGIDRNARILMQGRTEPEFDGYRQTAVQEVTCISLSERVFHYKMKNISVVPNFKYEHLLKF